MVRAESVLRDAVNDRYNDFDSERKATGTSSASPGERHTREGSRRWL